MEPKEAKTAIIHLEEGGPGFDFLGFHHQMVRSQGWQEVPSPQAGARVLVMAAPTGGLVAFGSVPGPERYTPAAWSTTLSCTPHTPPVPNRPMWRRTATASPARWPPSHPVNVKLSS